MNTYFLKAGTYNNACSMLDKLGYKEPLRTATKGDRTILIFSNAKATYNERTGTLKIVKL
jgi:hypothetical protein